MKKQLQKEASMLARFFTPKLARVSVLVLLVFLLVQSGVVRAQNSAGNVLRAVAPVSVAYDFARPPLQSGVILTAIGQACIDRGGDSGCVSWTFDFNPAGGPVSGSFDGTLTWLDWGEIDPYTSHDSGTLTGDFDGGDGGQVSGKYSGQEVITQGDTLNISGLWVGYLSADGTGSGTWIDNFGGMEWSVTFDAQAFQAALQPNPEPNPDPYIDPDPYIEPNPEPYPYPDPDPVPGPITIDQETLEMLQSILSAPALPITGAIAGGLVAWVISMLGGGRTVLSPAPRPPTGGVRPGQVGPDGKVWSPSQGWVTKSTYDYQQKWLQKGWQLNSQTGKLEVQPGAINEKGEVWYKLPHAMDEGDSHYWVDKAKVQECESNLAEGKVWNRALGWQTPEDSNRYESDRDGRRQRERESSADKNAEIQKAVQDASQKRKEEDQEWLKKYEQKEQMPVKLKKLEDDLDAIDQDLIKKNVYVLNKWQHDKTLIVHGLTMVDNLIYDHTLGQLTGSQGSTCGDYVEKTEAEVKAAVDKQFPGAKVQRVHFDEKSTKNPAGLWNYLDSKVTDNHILLKVTIPDGPELSVDFHGHNAKIVGEAPKIMRPFNESEEEWKKWLGEDEFVETVDP